MSSWKPRFYITILVFALFTGKGFAQEQWQVDQAAGKYWYVEGDYLYTYDPKENNPGTMFVILQGDGKLEILISPNLKYADPDKVSVKYAFNKSIHRSKPKSENWATTYNSRGAPVLVAPAKFINEFNIYSQKSGYVEIEITDWQGEVARRTFILDGYSEALSKIIRISTSDEEPPVAFNEHQEWYSGGTLHKATGSSWQQASYANQLATAADFSAKLLEGEVRFSSMDQLKPYATELTKCITGATAGQGGEDQEVSGIATLCAVLMGWN